MPNTIAGQYNSTPPTVGDKQYNNIQVDSGGNLKVAVQGLSADDALASGNPILVGGKYESALNVVHDGDASFIKVDSVGRILTIPAGNAAAGATDSGNPLKVGGVYNSSVPTLTNGQRGDLQVSSSSILRIVPMGGANTEVGGLADNADGVATSSSTNSMRTVSRLTAFSTANNWGRVYQAGTGLGLYVENGPYSYSRKTGDSQVKGSAGFLHCVTVAPSAATPAAGVITLYDSTTETGTVILAIAIPASVFIPYTLFIDAPFTTGLYCGFDGTVSNTNLLFTYR